MQKIAVDSVKIFKEISKNSTFKSIKIHTAFDTHEVAIDPEILYTKYFDSIRLCVPQNKKFDSIYFISIIALQDDTQIKYCFDYSKFYFTNAERYDGNSYIQILDSNKISFNSIEYILHEFNSDDDIVKIDFIIGDIAIEADYRAELKISSKNKLEILFNFPNQIRAIMLALLRLQKFLSHVDCYIVLYKKSNFDKYCFPISPRSEIKIENNICELKLIE
jgi:hypothetical protein